jgi:RimJ/RimL family protein N-acetyltransferase
VIPFPELADVVLTGRHVRLEPLTMEHVGALVRAASESRATYGLSVVPDGEEATKRYVGFALAERDRGVVVPFATVDLRGGGEGRVVGTTRFMSIEYWVWPTGRRAPVEPEVSFEAAEIGATWLAASAQRTAINTEAKLLMLEHAFEVWRLRRVNLKTDARNTRSRTAIERLGAKLDGVLRAHSPAADGGVRDTAMYSILAGEWEEVRRGLRGRLERG